MAKKRLLWQLYPSYALVALTALAGVTWYASYLLEQSSERMLSDRLALAAQLLETEVGPQLDPADAPRLAGVCAAVARATSVRLSIRLPSGGMLCASQDDRDGGPAPAENAAFPRAVAATVVSSDAAVEAPSRAIDLPIRREGRVIGSIHGVLPAAAALDRLRQTQVQLVTGALVVAGGCLGLCFFVARRVTRPFEEMRGVAERFASGDFDLRPVATDSLEMAGLAGALNEMASQLRDRLQTIVRQSNEQQAVLASMVEGVLALDSEQRVITLNKAAAALVGNTLANPLGRNLQEVVRNADLRRFADRVLGSNEPIEDDVILHGDPDRVLQIRGTALRDPRGRGIGAVVVLSDVTRLRRLETVRRDFVANVSHELKTPITSIKGFVETLLDGAAANPDDTQRFLRIVATQADRLNAIIEDLLSLSKIEQSESAADLALDEAPIKQLLEAVVHDCQPKAEERQIDVRVRCQAEVTARINLPLLEQAVTNLLDNAIKYSEPGSQVQITAARSISEVTIAVSDHGCGIDAEHLPRLFERFYRVDRARSRKLGGTGLGLAIVKHIVQAHHGRISVDSTPGVGSVFRVHLPVSRPPHAPPGFSTLPVAVAARRTAMAAEFSPPLTEP